MWSEVRYASGRAVALGFGLIAATLPSSLLTASVDVGSAHIRGVVGYLLETVTIPVGVTSVAGTAGGRVLMLTSLLTSEHDLSRYPPPGGRLHLPDARPGLANPVPFQGGRPGREAAGRGERHDLRAGAAHGARAVAVPGGLAVAAERQLLLAPAPAGAGDRHELSRDATRAAALLGVLPPPLQHIRSNALPVVASRPETLFDGTDQHRSTGRRRWSMKQIERVDRGVELVAIEDLGQPAVGGPRCFCVSVIVHGRTAKLTCVESDDKMTDGLPRAIMPARPAFNFSIGTTRVAILDSDYILNQAAG